MPLGLKDSFDGRSEVNHYLNKESYKDMNEGGSDNMKGNQRPYAHRLVLVPILSLGNACSYFNLRVCT